MTPQLLRVFARDFPPSRWADQRCLLGVSGGADSVALLRACLELTGAAARGAASNTAASNTAASNTAAERVIVAHYNHGLRGAASDADEAFVRALCQTWNVPLVVERAAAGDHAARRGEGLEGALRRQRHRFLLTTALARGARHVLLAHTADDQVETVLQRLVRGTGLAGLAGIPATREPHEAVTLARPLLRARRRDVLDYLAARGQDHREDESNQDRRFFRNRLRHELLPLLRRGYNAHVDDALLRLAELAGEAQAVLAAETRRLRDASVVKAAGEVILRAAPLLAAAPYLRRETLIAVWKDQGWPLQAMGQARWTQLADLLDEQAIGGRRDFPGAIEARRDAETLVLRRKT